jgi:hypothetical protein
MTGSSPSTNNPARPEAAIKNWPRIEHRWNTDLSITIRSVIHPHRTLKEQLIVSQGSQQEGRKEGRQETKGWKVPIERFS